MFDVRIIHDQHDRVVAIEFTDPPDFDWESGEAKLTVCLDPESGMDWHYVRKAVEQEAAAEDADMETEYTKGAAAYSVNVYEDQYDATIYQTTQLANLVDILAGPVAEAVEGGATALLTIDDGERDITVEVLP